MKFKIDTGADGTVLSKTDFEMLKHQPSLSEAPRQLYGADSKLLATRGVAKLELVYRDRETIQNVYVLDDVHTSLLGKPAIKDLLIVTFINVVARKVIPKDEFLSMFQGLDQL